MGTLKRNIVQSAGMLLMFLVWAVQAVAITIDVPPPAFDIPPSPWHSLSGEPTITYAFKISWDDIGWTNEQKSSAYNAFNYFDSFLPNQTFAESGDFSIRWARTDLFKDWRDAGQYTHPGWNLGGEPFTDQNGNGRYDPGEPYTDQNGDNAYNGPPLAIAYKHDNAPWRALGEPFTDQNGNGRYDPGEPYTDQNGDNVYNYNYPNNEIYFNTIRLEFFHPDSRPKQIRLLDHITPRNHTYAGL